ncbi:MAG: acyl-CoA dehydrogenase family protein, partial [Anaerolineae bacterium]
MPSLYFSEEHDMFRQTVRKFVEAEINPHVDEWETARIFPARALFKKMGDLGFLGLSYPEEYGGGGADYWYNIILAEELGRADCGGVPMAIAVHTDMATPALAQFGTPEQKERFLRPAAGGRDIACLQITEPQAGSDAANLRTRAEKRGDGWVLNGTKCLITAG